MLLLLTHFRGRDKEETERELKDMAGVLTANLVLQKTKLDNIKHVRKLNVCGVNVHDIGVLREAKNVEVLALSVNEIENLEALGESHNLKELYLRRNAITDLAQVLHLSRLPQLYSLTMSDNPVCQDPHYRSFLIAALPALTRLDEQDVSHWERSEAEKIFPDLSSVPPPPSVNSSPPRPMQTPRTSIVRESPSEMRQATASLNQRFDELSSTFDDMPVGGSRRSTVLSSARRSGNVPQLTLPRQDSATYEPKAMTTPRVSTAAPVAAAPFAHETHTHTPPVVGPREEGVVSAIKTLLNELSPAGLLAVRRFMDAQRM